MKLSFGGHLAAAALCAILSACGGSGGSSPTALPASVSITGDARVEAGSTGHFASDLAVTQGVTFRWDFGDGSSGSGSTVEHAYAQPGAYQITLAVANDAEDLRTTVRTIQVGAYANVAGLNCTQAASGGWCWQHTLVTGHQINDMFFVDASHAWAVGDDLTLLKSSDAGATWTLVPMDPQLYADPLIAVRFYDAQHGMALSATGNVLLTSDGGTTWTLATTGVYGGSSAIIEFSATRIVLRSNTGSGGAVSIDGGATWTPTLLGGQAQATATDCWSFLNWGVQRAAGCGAMPTTSLSLPPVNGYDSVMAGAFSSPTQGLVLASGYSYDTNNFFNSGWTTADGGGTWTPFTPVGLPSYYGWLQSLRMVDARNGVLFVPNDLTAWVTRDGGQTWAQVSSSPALSVGWNSYRTAGLINGNVLWQSNANVVSISTDLGQTWHDATIAAENNLQAVQTTQTSLIQLIDLNNFVVATSHRFYATHDGGHTFTQLLGPDSRDAGAQSAAIEFTDIRHGHVLSANGELLATADGGRTWTRQDYASHAGAAVALHFTSATEGWLILEGKLSHSTDGGATWSTPLVSSTMADLRGMSWGDARHAWAWTYASVFATADGGATWAPAAPLPNGQSVGSALLTGPLTGVVATWYGATLVTTNGGATWQAGSTISPIGPLVSGGGQTIWSLGSTLMRSKDGGLTWQVAGPNIAYATVTGLSFADNLHGWLVTNDGSVLRTVDGGDTWSVQPVGTDLSLQAIAAVDTSTAWIVTRDGRILATATAGN